MKRFLSYSLAALLSIGIIGSTLQTADAGKRERRIGAGIALGIIGGALIGNALADREYRKDRRRHYRDYPVRNRYYDDDDYAEEIYVQPRRYRAPRRAQRRNVRVLRLSAAHKGWCSTKYRSWRAYDNTFQPYDGPRRACYSPYN